MTLLSSLLSPPILGVQNIVGGRLCLATGAPVSLNVSGASATTLFYTPYKGNITGLYNGSIWEPIAIPEISIAVPATTNTMYDVFVYNNAGTPTLNLTAWTDDTTRSTALVMQDGVYVKTGALTHRWLGCIRTTGISGQTESTNQNRLVYNYYNQIRYPLSVAITDLTWTYNSYSTWRPANAQATANNIGVVTGAPNEGNNLFLNYQILTKSSGANVTVAIGIGADGSSPGNAGIRGFGAVLTATAAVGNAFFSSQITTGYHYYTPYESLWGTTDTVTFTRSSTVDCGHFVGFSYG